MRLSWGWLNEPKTPAADACTGAGRTCSRLSSTRFSCRSKDRALAGTRSSCEFLKVRAAALGVKQRRTGSLNDPRLAVMVSEAVGQSRCT